MTKGQSRSGLFSIYFRVMLTIIVKYSCLVEWYVYGIRLGIISA